RGSTRRRAANAHRFPAAVPSAAQVANGWEAQTRRGLRLVLPDARLAEAVAANRRYLLLFHHPGEITPGPATHHRSGFRDAAYLVAALDHYGFHSEAADALAGYPGRQRADGLFFSRRQEWDANGAALWTLAEHWRLTRNRDLFEPMATPVAKGAHWIERKRRAQRRRREPELRGLLPAGSSAEHGGPVDYSYWDDFWGVAGLCSAAELLDGCGQPEAAADAHRAGAEFWLDVERSLDVVASRLGNRVMPAGPRRFPDAGAISSLVACQPLGLLPPHHPAVVATVGFIRDRFLSSDGRAFGQAMSPTGSGPYLTLQLASVELAAGDRRALDRLAWMLDAATPTWTWPEAIHPRLPGGGMGDGHHGRAAAAFLSFVRTMLVREVDGGGGLALCSLLPGAWLGQEIEVHDAPTHGGRLSFALRWHGERPALLWQLDPHPGVGVVRLTAPGLDPAWSSTEVKGEALLGPVSVSL
ncbi:MAG: hypothetical protein ACRD0U_07850, partial [Acidimicrobiales bacterium]